MTPTYEQTWAWYQQAIAAWANATDGDSEEWGAARRVAALAYAAGERAGIERARAQPGIEEWRSKLAEMCGRCMVAEAEAAKLREALGYALDNMEGNLLVAQRLRAALAAKGE